MDICYDYDVDEEHEDDDEDERYIWLPPGGLLQ